MQNGVHTVTADSITIKDIYNNLDEHSIVTIKAPDVHSTEIKCSISELSKLCLYEKGTYEISFIDRTGHSYRFIAKITGNLTYETAVASNNLLSYTEFYDVVNLLAAAPPVDDSNNNQISPDNNQDNPNNNSSNNNNNPDNTDTDTENNTQNSPTTDNDDLPEDKDDAPAKEKLSWWVIALISVGTLIVLLIATAIASDSAEGWMALVWLLAIAALVLMFIFTTWEWWLISLIELGGIIVLTIIAAVLGENCY